MKIYSNSNVTNLFCLNNSSHSFNFLLRIQVNKSKLIVKKSINLKMIFEIRIPIKTKLSYVRNYSQNTCVRKTISQRNLV